ncbi:MAG: periplasmic heavy metal sensor [Paracoccaceae bacterium]
MGDVAGRAAPRWMKIVLALSLALNLAIAGLAVGAMLRGGPHGARDFGLGPLTEALSREDRKALRAGFIQAHPDLRADRQAARADFAALLQILRTDPMDPAALDAAMGTVADRNAALVSTARGLLAERLKAMTAAERTEFADRLQAALERPGRKKGDHAP